MQIPESVMVTRNCLSEELIYSPYSNESKLALLYVIERLGTIAIQKCMALKSKIVPLNRYKLLFLFWARFQPIGFKPFQFRPRPRFQPIRLECSSRHRLRTLIMRPRYLGTVAGRLP